MLPRSAIAAICLAATWSSAAHAHPGSHSRLHRLDQQIAKEPERADLLIRRAEVHRQSDHPALALIDVERAEALGAGVAAELTRGLALLDLDRAAEARAALERYLAAHSKDARARLAYARALDVTGPVAAAAAAWDAVRAVDPAPAPELRLQHAEALERADRIDDALVALRLPEGAAPVEVLSLAEVSLLERAGRTKAALKTLEAAARSSSAPAALWIRHATRLEQLHRRAEARTSWERASAALHRLPSARRRSAPIRQLYAQVREALRRP